MISPRKTLAAATAVGILAVAAPLSASAAVPTVSLPTPTVPTVSLPNPLAPNPNLCLSGVVDPGPFGPSGPYGPQGPYGPNGPLAGQPNPIGNAATCGGLMTYILRGGTLSSFVQNSIVP
jgi:hypothetical protein